MDRKGTRLFYDRLSGFYRAVGVFDNHFKRKALKCIDLRNGTSFLDVGCGDGYLLSSAGMRFSDCELFGIDSSLEMSRVANKKAIRRCHISAGDCFSLPYKSSSFDVVFSTFVLDLFDGDDRERVVGELCRVLKNHGTLVLVNNTRGSGFFWWLSSIYLIIQWLFPRIFLDMPISAVDVLGTRKCLEVRMRVVSGFTEIVVVRKVNN